MISISISMLCWVVTVSAGTDGRAPIPRGADPGITVRLGAVPRDAHLIDVSSIADEEIPPERDAAQARHSSIEQQLHDLEESRPGLGLPIALLSVAALPIVAGMFYFSAGTTSDTPFRISPSAFATGLIVVAAICVGAGIWVLGSRLKVRTEIDATIAKLREAQDQSERSPPSVPPAPGDSPPPVPSVLDQLPAPPLFAAYRWTF